MKNVSFYFLLFLETSLRVVFHKLSVFNFIFDVFYYIIFLSTFKAIIWLEALLGSSSNLPCPVANSPDLTLLLWYRGDVAGAPLAALDARASPPSTVSSVAGVRLSRNGNLQLTMVTADDGGEYRCRADFRWTRTRISTVSLKVIGKWRLKS